tara:strand:+ start:252 stop:893 length:642 start_codon:yes stop_codon:yes gene_type:complete
MNDIVNKEPSLDDLMFVLNKCIKFKDSNHKQNIRKKIKKNDKEDILTQLAYVVHSNVMNKSVIEIKSTEEIKLRRENIDFKLKLIECEEKYKEYEQTIKVLKNSNNFLRNDYNKIKNEIIDYQDEVQELRKKINDIKTTIKPIENNGDKVIIQDLKKINSKLVDRIHNGDFDNPTDKDVIIRDLRSKLIDKDNHMIELKKENDDILLNKKDQK